MLESTCSSWTAPFSIRRLHKGGARSPLDPQLIAGSAVERIAKVGYEAVAFDLLTALVDSWSLYARVAGSEALGRAWRLASLRRVTAQGTYRAYEEILADAAADAGVPVEKRDEIVARWGELMPWPDVPDVLARLSGRRLAIVTNCSQRLADIAAAATGGHFELVMSAERAGAYKTDPRAYRAGLDGLRLPPERVLFVAGSAHDVPGASQVGMPVYWHNRQRLPVPDGSPLPLFDEPDLRRLPEVA